MSRKTKFGLITPNRWGTDPASAEAYAMGVDDGFHDVFNHERYGLQPRKVGNAYKAGKLAGEQMRLHTPPAS